MWWLIVLLIHSSIPFIRFWALIGFMIQLFHGQFTNMLFHTLRTLLFKITHNYLLYCVFAIETTEARIVVYLSDISHAPPMTPLTWTTDDPGDMHHRWPRWHAPPMTSVTCITVHPDDVHHRWPRWHTSPITPRISAR